MLPRYAKLKDLREVSFAANNKFLAKRTHYPELTSQSGYNKSLSSAFAYDRHQNFVGDASLDYSVPKQLELKDIEIALGPFPKTYNMFEYGK